jgi:NAD(P)-dependent dehydrogenase (short-subunit alcohol dehydrogenase family)
MFCLTDTIGDSEDFDRVMAVNVRGVFLGMKYALPRMREGGSVVNMSNAEWVFAGKKQQAAREGGRDQVGRRASGREFPNL